jgi:circadian clock protein KaiC
LSFSPYGNALLADAVIMQGYVESEGMIKRVISVVKVRASDHSKQMRFYSIDANGLSIGEPLSAYTGVLTGSVRTV